jgi:hypothetical protein
MAREKEIQTAVERLKLAGWLLVDELPLSPSRVKEMLESRKVICVVVGAAASDKAGICLVHRESFQDYIRAYE